VIEFLKNWVSSDKPHSHEQVDDLVEAVSALLLEAAMIDGQIDSEEIEQTKHAICSFFDTSEEQATRTIQKLLEDAGHKHEFHSLTKQIRESCDYEERIYILSMLWQIVLADDEIDSLESSLMRRLSGLLFVSDVDSGKAKQQARNRLGLV
tara:strand:- start:693 stop:1145 length:453 start_codon:yes stop_codon:yes gene_type:complete